MPQHRFKGKDLKEQTDGVEIGSPDNQDGIEQIGFENNKDDTKKDKADSSNHDSRLPLIEQGSSPHDRKLSRNIVRAFSPECSADGQQDMTQSMINPQNISGSISFTGVAQQKSKQAEPKTQLQNFISGEHTLRSDKYVNEEHSNEVEIKYKSEASLGDQGSDDEHGNQNQPVPVLQNVAVSLVPADAVLQTIRE